ncbi:MAG: redoxin domain-containing protein [Phycisphaerales bacterium]|nr:redoxin domain-containing protein [Phycisphaerales bacterium]
MSLLQFARSGILLVFGGIVLGPAAICAQSEPQGRPQIPPAVAAPANPLADAPSKERSSWRRGRPSVFPGAKIRFPDVASWVQGDPITAWEPRSIYLIEFFLTTCGHCEESAPLIAEYARAFANRGVVLFAVTEEEPAIVAQWLSEENRREVMTYSIAADPDKSTLQQFQFATLQHTTPRIFIVQDGIVQWYGHPDDLDKPLNGVLDGTWNPESIRTEFVLNSQEKRARDEINQAYTACEKSGDWSSLRTLVDAIIAGFPERKRVFELIRFGALIGSMGEESEGYEYGHALALQYNTDANTLRSIARTVLNAPYVQHRDLPWAFALAQQADTLAEHKDARAAEALALAHWSKGDRAQALSNLERAISLDSTGKLRAEWSQKLSLWKEAAPGPVPSKPRNAVRGKTADEGMADEPSTPSK